MPLFHHQTQNQQTSPHGQQQQTGRKSITSISHANSAPYANRISARDQVLPVKTAPVELRTKLTDFSLAIELRKNEEVLAESGGIPMYMVPEVLTEKPYTKPYDVWSLGILKCQLLASCYASWWGL
ncbi:unnamed protein product [Echinostoma caproni]|uniref:Protein kinase domain-containing protein n=1 Tax=Echinostoma caproni TaxID=27848 RepID=A0A183A6I3_9TREM|nr:unnamed protein product [Echinostoma caproni]